MTTPAKEIIYRKVYIRSEDDLPKEAGFYFVNWTPGHAHHTTMAAQYYDESIKGLWFGKGWFDWYLLPVELPTEKEIVIAESISTYIIKPDASSFELLSQGFRDGVRWLISKLKGNG